MKEPIVLTLGGDVITYYPERKNYTDDDHIEGGQCIGIHLLCGSFIDCRVANHAMNALTCRGCFLRVEIPTTVTTTRELRKHFETLQPTAWSMLFEPGQKIVCCRNVWPFKRGTVGVIVDASSRSTYVSFATLSSGMLGDKHRHPLIQGMIGPYGAFVRCVEGLDYERHDPNRRELGSA